MDEASTTFSEQPSEQTKGNLMRLVSCAEDGFINFWTVEIDQKEEEEKIGNSL